MDTTTDHITPCSRMRARGKNKVSLFLVSAQLHGTHTYSYLRRSDTNRDHTYINKLADSDLCASIRFYILLLFGHVHSVGRLLDKKHRLVVVRPPSGKMMTTNII